MKQRIQVRRIRTWTLDWQWAGYTKYWTARITSAGRSVAEDGRNPGQALAGAQRRLRA